jgi:hypothetical protein
MSKKYSLSVVEEFWAHQRPHTHMGRIEVYDKKHHYDIYEARFAFDGEEELYQKFREIFDEIEVNHLPIIVFDYEPKGGK